MSSKVTNNESWNNIFHKFDIINEIKKNDFYDITSNDIKSVDGKEARLMTKIDFRKNLPFIMRRNGLSILAIKNGTYRIAKNDPFIDIPKLDEAKIQYLNNNLSSFITLNPMNIKSESGALDVASATGMLKKVFDEKNLFLGIRGRLRGSLNFSIGDIDYDVDGVQIEVDGGYEGEQTFNIVEAKIGYEDNINIRQLIYPELYWKNIIGIQKKVKSYIFYYENQSIYRFIPFIYDGLNYYANSKEEIAFKFKTKEDFDLMSIKCSISLIDKTAPIPQADDFSKLIDMMINIERETIQSDSIPTKISIFLNFNFDNRQADYYFNALKWLRLANWDKKEEKVYLTGLGKEILSIDNSERMEELAKIVFSEPLYNHVLKYGDKKIPKKLIDDWGLNETTFRRRLLTIRSWVRYFKKFFQIDI